VKMPPPSLPSRKGQSGRLLRRPQRDHHAATVADFCTAVSTLRHTCDSVAITQSIGGFPGPLRGRAREGKASGTASLDADDKRHRSLLLISSSCRRGRRVD
jgi:hypothetical protein